MAMFKGQLLDSISVKMLKCVFGAYCMVAIALTAFQAWGEYSKGKQAVDQSLAEHAQFLGNSVANAVWHFDIDQLDRIASDVMKNPIFVGMTVSADKGEVILRRGEVDGREESWAISNAAQDWSVDPVSSSTGLFWHELELFDPNGLAEAPIGKVTMYSSYKVVLGKVGDMMLTLIVIASIKTLALWTFFIYFGQRILSRPLLAMMDKIEHLPLKGEDKEKCLEKPGANELEHLDCALDQMSDRLKETLGQLHDANEKLSENNELLQEALENGPAAICVFDCDGEVSYANNRFKNMAGWISPMGPTGTQDSVRDMPQVDTELRSTLMPGEGGLEGRSREFHLTDSAGQSSWYQGTLSPVALSEEQLKRGLQLYIATDISQLKATEQSLQHKTDALQKTVKELETAHRQLVQSEKMASIGQLAAGVAHEINNPIGYVSSNMDTLRKYCDNLTDLIDLYEQSAPQDDANIVPARQYRADIDYEFVKDDIPELMSDTEEGIKRVRDIVLDLRDFSRESHEEWVSSDLRQCIETSINMVRNELKYKCQLIEELGDLPHIDCIPGQLSQVFMNLLVNAGQALEEQGIVTVRAGQQGDEVWVEVEDNGSGIAPVHLKRLFDPFFTTKPVGEGTGLGLSVSFGIIQRHGGEITVDSELGRGTTFRITLPIRQSIERALPETA